MSSHSLNRLLSGGGLSPNQKINAKYATMWRLPQDRNITDRNNNNDRNRLSFISTVNQLRRHQRFVNRFRGVKKEELDLQASIIICSMTVCTCSFKVGYLRIFIIFCVPTLPILLYNMFILKNTQRTQNLFFSKFNG